MEQDWAIGALIIGIFVVFGLLAIVVTGHIVNKDKGEAHQQTGVPPSSQPPPRPGPGIAISSGYKSIGFGDKKKKPDQSE